MVGAITWPGVGVKTNLKPTITPYVILNAKSLAFDIVEFKQ
jgi:hypothetical protein